MTNADDRLSRVREQARQMRTIGSVLMPILLAAILLPLIGELYLVSFEPAPWAVALGAPIAALVKLVGYTPALAGAGAVITLRPVFAQYEQGHFLSEQASTAFQRAGLWALAAFNLKLLVAPLVISMLGGAAFNWRFDPLDIALMTFAAFVLMIGGALQAAASALKAENDQIV